MKDVLLKALIVGYAGVGIAAAIGYWPTIKDIFFRKKQSANIQSYFIWTATSTITFLYSIFILKDLLFQIVAGVNFFSCALILLGSMNLVGKNRFRISVRKNLGAKIKRKKIQSDI